MLAQQFKDVLYANSVTDPKTNQKKLEKICYKVFEKSQATKKHIADMGLEKEIDDHCEVESNY